MQVHRVETRSGDGPYRGDSYESVKDVVYHHNYDGREMHPSPWTDGCYPACSDSDYLQSQEFVCGFISEQQLRRWFASDERAGLSRHNFVHAVYDVDPQYIAEGDFQIMFRKTMARFCEYRAL